MQHLGRDQNADLDDVPDEGGQHHGQAGRPTYSARSTAECDGCDRRRRTGERARAGRPQRVGHQLGKRAAQRNRQDIEDGRRAKHQAGGGQDRRCCATLPCSRACVRRRSVGSSVFSPSSSVAMRTTPSSGTACLVQASRSRAERSSTDDAARLPDIDATSTVRLIKTRTGKPMTRTLICGTECPRNPSSARRATSTPSTERRLASPGPTTDGPGRAADRSAAD